MIMRPFEATEQSTEQPTLTRSCADLHIHSKYSDRPSEWFLRRIGAPESFVEPRAVYDSCKAAGMDYVTIADHNCIDGALEISDLPGTFISTELTTYFPEDRCKIHCLVSGISSQQFKDLMEIRPSIYELRDYMLEHNVIHTITHPLFRINDKLSIEHVEKLLVMFNRFEGINGTRESFSGRVAAAVFSRLTPELIEDLANRHNLEPGGPTPWVKCLTGGSDDHGGLYSASSYTVTPQALTVYDYLDHLRCGRHEPGGAGGSSLQLADSLLTIGCDYYRSRLANNGGKSLLGRLLEKMTGHDGRPSEEGRLKTVAKRILTPIIKRHKYRQLSDLERELMDEFSKLAEQGLFSASKKPAVGGYEARFELASRLGHHLGYAFLSRCSQQISKGSLIGGLQAIASLVPVGIGMTPYLAAFATQHKDDPFLRTVAAHFGCDGEVTSDQVRRAWLTDTFDDVNGVAKTIRKLASLAHENGMPLTVVTCLESSPEASYPVQNFEPVGMFALPEYPSQKMAFPPFLDMIAWLERAEIDELLISTPGPVGLVGVAAAKLLGIPATGIYHTDFPRYIQNWTDDEAMADLARRFMRWFYGRMASIYAPTRAYVSELSDMGFDPDILRVLPRGVDTDLFSPEHRDEGYWAKYDLNGGFKFIYVGRVSNEKNVRNLMEAYRGLANQGVDADLAVVGDGPELKALRKEYSSKGVAFTGYLYGEDLAKAYASADALVFPSLTDTFGNVVLEAHASGLPAIVSDQGGPQEIVRANDSGMVVDTTAPHALTEAMATMVRSDGSELDQFRERALATARSRRWQDVLGQL